MFAARLPRVRQESGREERLKVLKNKKNILLPVLGILLFCCCLSMVPLSWNNTVTNFTIDMQLKLRGERQFSDKILVVYVGQDDVQSLGWPLTRDYFGYITHILQHSGAKVISFDILFSTKDTRYPEYDESLADFFEIAGNISLPMTFSEIKNAPDGSNLLIGESPNFPISEFKDLAAGIGFSYLGEETIIRKVPLIVKSGDDFVFSFGCELARSYLGGTGSFNMNSNNIQFSNSSCERFSVPVDQNGFFRLNHFGDPQKISSISLVELIQTYRSNPDSLNLSEKLVLVAVTSPEIAKLKVTPLSAAFPASFIHATVAENIIEQNYFRVVSGFFELLLIFLPSLFLMVIWKYQIKRMFIYSAIGIILLFWLISILLFNFTNLIVPIFYPTLAYLTLFTFFSLIYFKRQHQIDLSQKLLLETEIKNKQKQLEDAETNFTELQEKLNHELKEKEALSEESQSLLTEKMNVVQTLEKQLRDLQTYTVINQINVSSDFPEIIHSEKSKLVEVINLVTKIGSDDISVLISGETGTGKELIARAIHKSGKRTIKPFVAVNCGALPETLLESELFGHEKGSFTGAQSQRRGRFELANGGTLFLDEITETTPGFQAKLLRVLQEGTFERLGGERTIKVYVRIIAASSKDLKSEVDLSRFREDLFYRLNGFPLFLPPLRERKEDIPLLVSHFLKKHDYHELGGFSDRVMEVLLRYHWPGNVRELENVVRRCAILAQSENRKLIQIQDLPIDIIEEDQESRKIQYQPIEKQVLDMLRFLKFSHSAISQTAKALGNRDRGTITEYFKGICFKNMVNTNFDVKQTAVVIAGTNDEEIVNRVLSKLIQYVDNIKSIHVNETQANNLAKFKGLPRKYHPYLLQVIDFYNLNDS